MAELQFAAMPIAEKLRMMEELWDSIGRQEEELPVPQWHQDLLDERERLVNEGRARFTAWETAKKRISERVA